MKAFEIKTNRSDYPYIVIADGFKKAIEMLYKKEIYDSNILYVRQLEEYKSDHILIWESFAEKEHLKGEIIHELQTTMPHWKRMLNGAAGGGDRDKFLIRSSRGHYFMSSCIGGEDYYLELDSLEQLPGLPKDE